MDLIRIAARVAKALWRTHTAGWEELVGKTRECWLFPPNNPFGVGPEGLPVADGRHGPVALSLLLDRELLAECMREAGDAVPETGDAAELIQAASDAAGALFVDRAGIDKPWREFLKSPSGVMMRKHRGIRTHGLHVELWRMDSEAISTIQAFLETFHSGDLGDRRTPIRIEQHRPFQYGTMPVDIFVTSISRPRDFWELAQS
jgi:hypothetical protein